MQQTKKKKIYPKRKIVPVLIKKIKVQKALKAHPNPSLKSQEDMDKMDKLAETKRKLAIIRKKFEVNCNSKNTYKTDYSKIFPVDYSIIGRSTCWDETSS